MRRASLPFDRQCEAIGLPKPEAEYQFAPPRRWKFDWAWPRPLLANHQFLLAVEQEGGAWIQGRHTRGKGYEADLEKYNEAVILGWKVLRFTPSQVSDGTALTTIERLLKG